MSVELLASMLHALLEIISRAGANPIEHRCMHGQCKADLSLQMNMHLLWQSALFQERLRGMITLAASGVQTLDLSQDAGSRVQDHS